MPGKKNSSTKLNHFENLRRSELDLIFTAFIAVSQVFFFFFASCLHSSPVALCFYQNLFRDMRRETRKEFRSFSSEGIEGRRGFASAFRKLRICCEDFFLLRGWI